MKKKIYGKIEGILFSSKSKVKSLYINDHLVDLTHAECVFFTAGGNRYVDLDIPLRENENIIIKNTKKSDFGRFTLYIESPSEFKFGKLKYSSKEKK